MLRFKPLVRRRLKLPVFLTRVRAGFPSPADDYIEGFLDLNEHLIKKPSSTFFARAEGDSMRAFNITDGDLLVVDRSLTGQQGSIVIAAVNGELTCKQLDIHGRQLLSGNQRFPPILIGEDMDAIIEGVVIWSIKRHF